MKNILTAQRRNEIAAELMSKGTIQASAMAEKYNVSTETIRKDIIYLEEMGLAQKSYGGAIATQVLIEQPIAVKEVALKDEKAQIAAAAAAMIPENASILLDGGSSTFALAGQLTMRSDLTIFTNAINIMYLLSSSSNHVFCIGGRVRPSSRCSVGGWADEHLLSIKPDLAFLGTDHFQGCSGPTSASFDELHFKKTAASQSVKTVILADYTKFQGTNLFTFCEWQNVYRLLTNRAALDNFPKEVKKIQQSVTIQFA